MLEQNYNHDLWGLIFLRDALPLFTAIYLPKKIGATGPWSGGPFIPHFEP